MHNELTEHVIAASNRALTPEAERFLCDARHIAKSVNCFDFVPSNYENAWRILDTLPRGLFCEWGSGLGAVTGLAEMLGFDACGIEQDHELCLRSRDLFFAHRLNATIYQGSYFESAVRADIYYVYCWPSIFQSTEEHFKNIAIPTSRLLICHGQDDTRVKRLSSET